MFRSVQCSKLSIKFSVVFWRACSAEPLSASWDRSYSNYSLKHVIIESLNEPALCANFSDPLLIWCHSVCPEKLRNVTSRRLNVDSAAKHLWACHNTFANILPIFYLHISGLCSSVPPNQADLKFLFRRIGMCLVQNRRWKLANAGNQMLCNAVPIPRSRKLLRYCRNSILSEYNTTWPISWCEWTFLKTQCKILLFTLVDETALQAVRLFISLNEPTQSSKSF